MRDFQCKNLDNSGQTWTAVHIRNGFGEQGYPEGFVILRHRAPSSPMTTDSLLLPCKLFLGRSQPAEHPLATTSICQIPDMLYFSLSLLSVDVQHVGCRSPTTGTSDGPFSRAVCSKK